MRRVLVCDDSAVARYTLCAALRMNGAEVVETDSREAGCRVDSKALGCAILDLDLGDGTGVEVAEALLLESPALPIAFFSGGAASDVETRARAIGPVFAKPGALDDVVAWAISR